TATSASISRSWRSRGTLSLTSASSAADRRRRCGSPRPVAPPSRAISTTWNRLSVRGVGNAAPEPRVNDGAILRLPDTEVPRGEELMEVRTAEHMGMCFGVRDAIELAVRLTRQGPLTILGDLVHNPDVVARMDAAGAVRAHEPQDVQTRAVLLTAHGTSQR